MYSIGVLSSSNSIIKMIEDMLLGFADILPFNNPNDLLNFYKGNNLDFLILEKKTDTITAKTIVEQMNEPIPTLLLVNNQYNPDIDGKNYSFVLRKPFKQEELREIVSYFLFSHKKTDKKGNNNILIVDDSKISREIAKSSLSIMGYNILEASSGRDAINKLDKFEEYFMRTISKNLHLEHSDLIATKLEVKKENGIQS